MRRRSLSERLSARPNPPSLATLCLSSFSMAAFSESNMMGKYYTLLSRMANTFGFPLDTLLSKV
jgi:hypothetical protein